MKKRVLTMMLVTLLMMTIGGCGSSNELERVELKMNSVVETEQLTNTMEGVVAQELTFADLSKRQFGFSSGAGGWGEEFVIEKDGYFWGKYQDADVGSVYFSSYSGHFTNLTKVDDYTYHMTLSDISYKYEPDSKENIDGILYTYTETYCLGGNENFTIYLPGTPLSNLSESVICWIGYYNQSETELTMPIIVDEENEYGIYSHERLSPVEDAKATLSTYQESFDYYNQLISETSTTMDWVIYTGRLYELSDECLNYLWNLIRYNVEEERYQEILAEQRSWIAEKEKAAEAARDEWEGGSFAPVAYNDMMAIMTIERCQVLAGYLE